ncbi:MAG: helix-turn-helix domain-containing protein [Oligoflexia bacterium]|nr:helix-turn-helix domain-containing protein [Oligoflexia bacterium]
MKVKTRDREIKLRYSKTSDEVENSSLDKLFNKKIWRVSDVAKFLGCSIGHIYNLVSDDKIPRVKKGKFLYFIPEAIHDWLLEGDLQ